MSCSAASVDKVRGFLCVWILVLIRVSALRGSRQAGTLSYLQLEPMVCSAGCCILDFFFLFVLVLLLNLRNPADWYDLFVLTDSSTFVAFNLEKSAD
jgi:hypothetical protein